MTRELSYSNVNVNDIGEYFIRSMVVDECGKRVDCENQTYLFTADKGKLAERNLLAADSIVNSENGRIWIRIYMVEGGSMSLHAGTNLGHVEPIIEMEDRVIRNVNSANDPKITNIITKIRVACEEGLSLPKEADEVMKIIEKHKTIFSTTKLDMGKTNMIEHEIKTTDNKPIAFKPRRIPRGMEQEVNQMVNELLQTGVIQPSSSPWNFPIVIVNKKNGDNSMCIDYRALNAKTERPIFSIPSSEKIFECVGGAKYFSKLYLSGGYHQVPINQSDREKTAFSTRYGQYEFNRMPFGLCSAPATFQRLMNLVLRKENWLKCVIYLDDILIFGSTMDEHNERLDQVLTKIKEAGLKLAPEKCHFLRKEVHYLGHVINATGVTTDPEKIESIQRWALPKCKKEMQAFLGFCNYYRRFIQGYASLTEPLSGMIKSDNKFDWTDNCKNSF